MARTAEIPTGPTMAIEEALAIFRRFPHHRKLLYQNIVPRIWGQIGLLRRSKPLPIFAQAFDIEELEAVAKNEGRSHIALRDPIAKRRNADIEHGSGTLVPARPKAKLLSAP